ncbi:MAG: DegV family EDD domain-containing protein [Lachnospiraceae bacterium]|nr:DegV family EDD domain-containing protein [Lachnospiraceae bacterium]
MRFWKDWIAVIRDPEADAYERRFRLFAPVGISTVLIWLVIISIVDFQLLRLLFFSGMLLAYGLTVLIAVRTGHTQTGTALCACGMMFALMPYCFIMEGGVYAGAFNYAISSLIFILMAAKGILRTVLIAADLAAVIACFLLSYAYPSLMVIPEQRVLYINAFTEMIISFILAFTAIAFQLYMFGQDRRRLEQQRDEIEDLNKAQNRFFSSMSHEIRTPINTIIGMNELLLRDETLTEETVTRLESVHSASNMLLSLINDILDVSKMESGKMEIVPVAYDTASIITEATEMIAARAKEKGLKFQVHVDETLPVMLYGDEVRIKQVLVNLLNNAVKYTERGSVTLSVQGDRLDDSHIRMTARVEDTGMGIKKEAIPHLFDAFKRVDEEKNRNIEGTGLGLSIVKQIMDLMGGEISVSSIYTKGSTFTMSVTQEIVVPTQIGSMEQLAHAAAAKREIYRQSFEAPEAKLLIVDDNEMNLQVEAGLLKETKIGIDTATSGAQALWRTLHAHYDVIFMDHLMPGMDGIACLKEIREQEGGMNRETPVLVLTANAGAENQALYAAAGFDGYLLKPVSGQQLESALIRALPEDKVRLTGTATMQSATNQVFTQLGRKKNVVITMDSGGDLPKDITDRMGIGIVNFVLHTAHGAFLDNLEVDSAELMRYMEDARGSARSEVPDIAVYENFFGLQLAKAQHVIHFTIARSMSKSYDNAVEASKSFDNVTVVDSGAVSSGMGLLVLYAAHLSQTDLPVSEILRRVEELHPRIRNSFVMESGAYLRRGGRISAMLQLVLDAFLLHPLIEFRDRKLHSRVVLSAGYRKKYVQRVMKKYGNADRSLLFIAYVSLTERELKEIRELVERYVHFDRVYFVKASSAIAVNCGPGTLGLMFCVQGEGAGTGRIFDFLPEEEIAGADIEEAAASAEQDARDESETPDPAAPRDDMDSGEQRIHHEDDDLDSDAPGGRMDSAERLVRHGAETTGSAECPAKSERSGIIGRQGSRLTPERDGTIDHPGRREHNLPLDTEEALRHCGSREVFDSALKLFAESAKAKADEIEAFLREEDWENYTIKVHALKSSARLIGATALSEDAKALEALGNMAKETDG